MLHRTEEVQRESSRRGPSNRQQVIPREGSGREEREGADLFPSRGLFAGGSVCREHSPLSSRGPQIGSCCGTAPVWPHLPAIGAALDPGLETLQPAFSWVLGPPYMANHHHLPEIETHQNSHRKPSSTIRCRPETAPKALRETFSSIRLRGGKRVGRGWLAPSVTILSVWVMPPSAPGPQGSLSQLWT